MAKSGTYAGYKVPRRSISIRSLRGKETNGPPSESPRGADGMIVGGAPLLGDASPPYAAL